MNKPKRKILIQLEVDWDGYEDVSDELIMEDAIEIKVDGVTTSIIPQLDEQNSTTLGVGDGTGEMFAHGSYEAMKLLQSKLIELEDLRRYKNKVEEWFLSRPEPTTNNA